MPTTTVKAIGTGVGAAASGTVTATNGSTAVTGSGTAFTTDFAGPVTIEIAGVLYNIASITDDTNLVLKDNYTGTTGSGKAINKGLRHYSTIQAWEDACPGNLVTEDKVWKGECYNDSEFTAGLITGGITTDATRYPWLTTASGESAYDDSSNALVYNQTNGVGVSITWTGISSAQVKILTRYMRVGRIQWKFNHTGGADGSRCIDVEDDCRFYDGIVEAYCKSGAGATHVIDLDGYYGARDPIITNILVVLTNDNATDNVVPGFRTRGGLLYNCGVVCPSNLTNPSTGAAFVPNGYQNSTLLKSCYSFNCSGFAGGTWQTGTDYNAADDTTPPGAASQPSLTFADQFVSTTNTDWKLKSGSLLIAGGSTDAANPNDIFGTVRGTTTDGDVGPHEFVAAGGGRIMSSLAGYGGLAGHGGLAGQHGGLAG